MNQAPYATPAPTVAAAHRATLDALVPDFDYVSFAILGVIITYFLPIVN